MADFLFLFRIWQETVSKSLVMVPIMGRSLSSSPRASTSSTYPADFTSVSQPSILAADVLAAIDMVLIG
jgi:hypothetical protein